MITKEGVVTQTTGSIVLIQTTRSKSCDSCASKDSCGEHSKTEQMTIQVENSLNASKGDRVVVGFKTAPLLKIAFMLYIFPIILMIIGAVIGESSAIRLNIDKSIASMAGGFLFFVISFFIIRFINNLLAEKKDYQPFLMRLMQRGDSCHLEPCSVKSSLKTT
ncbi:MAG: SoxR reducing system RseC family protein [Desulfamplus sp.]|nr:SoxR reducing system RseC family protein [Desulfamplus sp.]